VDPSTLSTVLSALGLTKFVPVVLALSTLASALDAILPQPAPGSHWLPARKLLSIAALNVHYASNAAQPPLVTWLRRVAAALVTMLPPPEICGPQGHPAARVEPTLAPIQPGLTPKFPSSAALNDGGHRSLPL